MAGAAPAFLANPLYSEPVLTIVRQPQKRGYRFRYSSEGLTHGGIRGDPKPGEKETRIYPTIKLSGHRGPAKVVLTIVTANKNHHLHAHSLIVNKTKTPGYHVMSLDGKDPTSELTTVAIQHVVKEKLTETVMDRILQTHFLRLYGWSNSVSDIHAQQYSDLTAYANALRDREDNASFMHRVTNKEVIGQELSALENQAKELEKSMDMNKCRLCFQVFLKGEDGHFSRKLDPVYSDDIYDAKTKHGAALKIMRMSKVASSVRGDEEVWLIADKLHADDLEVRFFEEPKAGGYPRGWEDFGKFQRTDVLKQICLIFRTPKYHDEKIDQPVDVSMQLRRKSDPDCVSDIRPFKYTPIVDRYGIGEKRRKEIPMDEILNFSQSMQRRSLQPSCIPSLSANNNLMSYNFPNMNLLNMMAENQQLNPNLLPNFNSVPTTTCMNINSSLQNFGTSTYFNLSGPTTAINTSSVNFPLVSSSNSRPKSTTTSVNINAVDSSRSVSSNLTGLAEASTHPTIKEEGVGDQTPKLEPFAQSMETESNMIDVEGTSQINVNLSQLAKYDGHSESLLKFLTTVRNSNDNC